jgi:glyoxylase-like metal-dependent hydrolase (beta-lactamase superfamily II)
MAQNPLERFASMRGKSPDEAKFFWTGGPLEIADRTWFQSSFSGCIGFETDEGIVLVDSGLQQTGPRLAEMLRQKTQAPIHTAIFTQGHVDHAFGLKAFLVPGQASPRVVGHRDMPARFARYARTQQHNRAINARQFGGTVQRVKDSGAGLNTFGTPDLPPTELYEERLDLTVGGVRFEVHHCRGETDDHSWVFCPERGVLCPGDLFIYAVPNAGNPQKVQRYPWDWADGLREMARREPESLCPGHGGPVVRNAPLVKRMLLETADYLDEIVARTLAALEDDSPPHVDIVHRVELPKSDSPWLQPVYDEGEFIVRNIIRFYGGWWNGRPSDLKPAPRETLAREMAALAGGAGKLIERALVLESGEDIRLACHLADYALEAAPGDPAVQSAVAALYERRAARETSLMATNLCRSAAAYAREGRPYR